jgi:hypothetical protein
MKRIYLIIMVAALCVSAHTASAAPIVSIEPSHLDVLQGDLVTVNITVDPQGVETMGAQYYLYFNNTLLNATEQVEGYFLNHDGANTLVMPNRFNNTIGLVEYGETRIGVTYGVTAYGVLASVTFRALEPGVCSLNLGGVVLSDPNANEISGVVVNNATIEISETHFTISGYVDYDNGDAVLTPNVMVTNLNTSEVFTADVNDSSNYYQISTNFAHISSDDVLHFDVSDGMGNFTAFHNTVTQGEMDAGGFVQNITIHIPDTTPPVITDISATAITKDSATITWDTDEPSDSLVRYGTEPGNYTQVVYDASYVMNHSIYLAELSLDTTYYYVVNSTDPSGNSARSAEQNFKTFPEIIIRISDAVAMTGENATTSIVITNITNLGTADITLTYNQSVVQVIAVNDGDFDFLGADIDNVIGRTRIGAFQTSNGGLNGSITVANIALGAVGGGGDFTALCLTINELKEAGFEELSIPASVHNGTFTVWEMTPPLVVNPEAYPPSIPEDTDFNPGWGETSRLNVTVTDDCGVESVTINLSSIGGLPDQPMTCIPDTDIWTVTTNASAGTAVFSGSYLPHNLAICAIDAFGNVNTSASIPLTVIRNGDVSENGEVTLYDATYLANHILNKPGFGSMNAQVADVSNNGLVTFYDSMYLSKHILAEYGFGILH